MMKKVSKKLVILAIVLVTAALLTSSFAAPEEKLPGNPEQTSPAQKKILIEAAVIEINTDALFSSKVNPVDRRLNLVSIEKISQCMENNKNGKVLTRTTTTIISGQSTSMSESERFYLPFEKTVTTPDKKPYKLTEYIWSENEVDFKAAASVKPDGKVEVKFAFKQKMPKSVFAKPDKLSTDKLVIEESKWEWNANVNLEVGKPSIVAAVQHEQTAVFLILCAEIEK